MNIPTGSFPTSAKLSGSIFEVKIEPASSVFVLFFFQILLGKK